MFVVERNELPQVFTILLFDVLSGAERIPPQDTLRLLKSLLTQARILKGLIPLEGNFLHTHLLPAIHHKGDDYAVHRGRINLLPHIHLGVPIPFFVVILANDPHSRIYGRGRCLLPVLKIELVF